MKSLELQPTYENLISTFNGDLLDRNQFLYRFIELLDAVEDGCVIAIDNQWGSGKTFFVKQAKLLVDSFNGFTNYVEDEDKKEIIDKWKRDHNGKEPNFKAQVTAYYDAWEYDNDDDPLLSIVYEIYKTVNNSYSFSSGPDCLKVLEGLVNLITKKSLSSIIEGVRSESNSLDSVDNNRDLRDEINNFFESLLPEQGYRLIVFIDELDRCSPSYAVKLLERIKHYFNNENITFVLSVNSIELQNTIKQFYGQQFDSCRYLDRFFDLRTSLPKPDLKNYLANVRVLKNSSVYDSIVKETIDYFNFELREITRFLLLIKIAAHGVTYNGASQKNYYYLSDEELFCLYISPIVIGLKMKDTKQYLDFISGKNSEPLLKIFGEMYKGRYIKDILLAWDETYSENNTDKKLVIYEERLNEAYQAIFGEYKDYDEKRFVGQICFTNQTIKTIEKVTSLLSEFADFGSNGGKNNG